MIKIIFKTLEIKRCIFVRELVDSSLKEKNNVENVIYHDEIFIRFK
jgi:hypothetical protein